MSLKDNAYQANKSQKEIDPLTSFLEDIQCLQGQKKNIKAHFYTEGKEVKSLDRFLFEAEADKEIQLGDEEDDENSQDSDEDNMQQQIANKADEKEQDEIESRFYLAPNQRYFMGAGPDPLLTIVTQVSDDKVRYYQYPWKKEQTIRKDIAKELLRKGCETWLEKNQETHEEDLKKSIEAVLNGKPGEKVTLEDYQFANAQIKYTGSEKGDEKPWHELEQNYNVNVSGVLANKQTYNVRLTNRALGKLEDELRQADPDERHFKIVKIMKEEHDLMLECGVFPLTGALNPFGNVKPKTVVRDVPSDDLESLKRVIDYGKQNHVVNGDYEVGETVVFDDEQWTIAEFIPWLTEVSVLLVNLDNTKVADQVPLKKIRKLTPEELSGLKAREAFITGKKLETLNFPQSNNDGSVIEKKNSKKKVKLNEGLFEDFKDFVKNDPNIYKKNISPVIKNLTNKWNDNTYNSDLAFKSFRSIVEEAGKKFYLAHDGEYSNKSYENSNQMIPDDIKNKVSNDLKNDFEREVDTHIVQEAIENICESGIITKHNKPKPDEESGEGSLGGTDGVNKTDKDSLTIGAPFSEAEEGNNSSAQENIPFTDKEKNTLKEISDKVKMDVMNNSANISWDGPTGLVRLTITKISNPNQKTFAYSSNSKINNELDKDRTMNSDSFDTQDSVDILSDFLASLNINQDELDEDKKLKIKPVVRVKYVNSYPVRDEKKVKTEVIGSVKYIYKLAKDMKKYKQPKPKFATKKRIHKHYQTKIKAVSSYPIRDGKPVKSEVIGNVMYRYRTPTDKKVDAQKRKIERKQKHKTTKKLYEEKEQTIILKTASNNTAVIKINNKEIRIKRYEPFDINGQEWVFTNYEKAEDNDENKPGIVLVQSGEGKERSKIISLIVDEPSEI